MVSSPFPPHSRSGPAVPRITSATPSLGLGFEHTGRQSGFPPPTKCFSDSCSALGDLALGSIDHSEAPRLNRMRPEPFPSKLNESGDQAGLASDCPFGGVSRMAGACGAPEGSNASTASWPLGVM